MIHTYIYIDIGYIYIYVCAIASRWPSIAVVFPKHLNLHPVKTTASQGWSVDVIGCRQSCGTTTTGDWGKTPCGVKRCGFQPFGYVHVTPRKFNIAPKKLGNPKRKLVSQKGLISWGGGMRGYPYFPWKNWWFCSQKKLGHLSEFLSYYYWKVIKQPTRIQKYR